LASIEANNQQWQDSAADFSDIMKVNPDHQKARERLGEVYFMWAEQLAEAGDHEQAVERYRDAEVFRQGDAELHAHLGTALAELKRYQEARAEFENVLRIDPNSQDAKQALIAIDARQRLTNQ
jgi:tetratricopeptide (TPR) repeat protein